MEQPVFYFGLLKILVALPIVIILIYISLKLTKSYMDLNGNKSDKLKVLQIMPLYNKSAIGVVKIGKEYIALGITEKNINIIKTLDHDELDEKWIINNDKMDGDFGKKLKMFIKKDRGDHN